MASILIAEDDGAIREGLVALFSNEGYATRAVCDGAAVIDACAISRPDILLLDVMMPRKSGYDVVREIRAKDAILPILLLTAKGAESDKVLGLGLGADDFITKPFSAAELLARVAAALRRSRAAGDSTPLPHLVTDGESIPLGTHTFWPKKYQLADEKKRILTLTAHERDLLSFLIAHKGEILSRSDIMDVVWGASLLNTRTLDQHILMLRHKLGLDSVLIETIYKVGYRLNI